MNAARARLEAFRESRKEKEEDEPINEQQSPKQEVVPIKQESPPSIIWKVLNIDFFKWIPTYYYHDSYERNPRKTLAVSFLMYSAMQYWTYSVGFGAVFFIFSLLIALFLSLGKKEEGEISAYSVFNPDCERLLGQMTAEHFERDVIRRRI